MTVDELFDGEVVDALQDASARGVDLESAGLSADVQERIDGQLPQAERFESVWAWEDTPAGRLLVVDRETTLVSVLVEPGETPTSDRDGGGVVRDAPSSDRVETAIWGSGESDGLVVVLNATFTWQLPNLE